MYDNWKTQNPDDDAFPRLIPVRVYLTTPERIPPKLTTVADVERECLRARHQYGEAPDCSWWDETLNLMLQALDHGFEPYTVLESREALLDFCTKHDKYFSAQCARCIE